VASIPGMCTRSASQPVAASFEEGANARLVDVM